MKSTRYTAGLNSILHDAQAASATVDNRTVENCTNTRRDVVFCWQCQQHSHDGAIVCVTDAAAHLIIVLPGVL